MKSAILLSGGLDSTALAYWLRPELAITIDYGQVAAKSEFRAARAVSRFLGIKHEEFTVDLRSLGSGPMVQGVQSRLASTPEWWPFRNQILITLAGAIALRHGMEELLLGTVSTDAEHADGTERFFRVMNELMQSQEGNLNVRAPAITLSTEELVRKSGVPTSVLGWCHSCNVAETPCLQCRACNKQIQVYESLSIF